MSATVSQIMTRDVCTVGLDDSLATVRTLFSVRGFHHLLVVESSHLVGVVSDRDLLKALSPKLGTYSETARDTATLNQRVHQVMSRKLLTLSPDASIDDAIEFFARHRVSCIPVVDDDARPCGIVSWRDILRLLRVTESSDGAGPVADELRQRMQQTSGKDR
jgi:acetoin utilization protein AcuB